MSEKEEFTTVISKSKKKKTAKSLREKSPTPKQAIPDNIGGTTKTKKSSSKKSKKGEQTTSETSETRTSEDAAPEKIHSDEQIAQKLAQRIGRRTK